MNPPIKNFIKHPFCSNRIEQFCRELEQADIHQKFPIPKNLTSEEEQIIYDLLKNGYIAYETNNRCNIIKCTFYPHALQSVYDCMQKGSSINKNFDFYNSLIADCKYDETVFAQIFIDALCTQNTIWIANNLKPLFDYVKNHSLYNNHIFNEDLDLYLYDSINMLTIYSHLHPDLCTDPSFKIPTESQRKQFLANISISNPLLQEELSHEGLDEIILLLKYIFGISDAYLYFDINEPFDKINTLYDFYFPKFSIISFPSFIPRVKYLIDILSINNNDDFDFEIEYLTSTWLTAELITYLSQYQSIFKNLPSNLKIIQYLLENNTSEKALELLKMNFLDAEDYPLLLNDICSESLNIPAEDKAQIMELLHQKISDSSQG